MSVRLLLVQSVAASASLAQAARAAFSGEEAGAHQCGRRLEIRT